MSWFLDQPFGLHHGCVFALVLARVSGLVLSAPVLSGVEIPMQVRGLLSLSLALLLTPAQWGAALDVPQTTLDLAMLMGSEVLIGLILGLGVTILISGLQLAGHVIGQLSGMSLAEVFNPDFDAELPLISQLLYVFALTIFVLLDGHRLLVGGLLDTFATLPPGSATVTPSLVEALTTLLTQSFELGIRVAAPATVALLLATLILGIISRTMPQLNVMALGFGLNALATFGALWVSLGSAVYVFQEQLEPALDVLLDGLVLCHSYELGLLK